MKNGTSKKVLLLNLDKKVIDGYNYDGFCEIEEGNNLNLNITINHPTEYDKKLVDYYNLPETLYSSSTKIKYEMVGSQFSVTEIEDEEQSIYLFKGSSVVELLKVTTEDDEKKEDIKRKTEEMEKTDRLLVSIGLASGYNLEHLRYDATYFFTPTFNNGGLDYWKRLIKEKYKEGYEVVLYSKWSDDFLLTLADKLEMNRLVGSDQKENWCVTDKDYCEYAWGDPTCGFPNLIRVSNCDKFTEKYFDDILNLFNKLDYQVLDLRGKNLFIMNLIKDCVK